MLFDSVYRSVILFQFSFFVALAVAAVVVGLFSFVYSSQWQMIRRPFRCYVIKLTNQEKKIYNKPSTRGHIIIIFFSLFFLFNTSQHTINFSVAPLCFDCCLFVSVFILHYHSLCFVLCAVYAVYGSFILAEWTE